MIHVEFQNSQGVKIGELGTESHAADSTIETYQIAPNEHVYGISVSVDLSEISFKIVKFPF